MKIESFIEMEELLSHPFIQSLENGEYTINELKIFAEQYYILSNSFVELLLLGSSRIKKDADRAVFIENLYDEHGRGVRKSNHRELFKKFLHATGCHDENKIIPLDSTLAYIYGMRELCRNGTQFEVLGAFGPGCESITVKQYTLIINALEKKFNFNEDELSFFSFHICHDPRHAADIAKIIKLLPNNSKDRQQIESGARISIILETLFWNGIYNACKKPNKYF